MLRKPAEKVACPCCGKERATAQLLEQEETIARRGATPCWGERGWAVSAARRRELAWACRECLSAKRALPGAPWLQTFCDSAPFLAYFDRVERCESCEKKFTFGAREQQYWYEQLKFWVQSHPKRCLACRRATRERKRAQAAVVETMAKLDATDPIQLAGAAATLLAAGSPRKAAELLRRAKNLTRDDGMRAQLIQQLESLSK